MKARRSREAQMMGSVGYSQSNNTLSMVNLVMRRGFQQEREKISEKP
jgi:hypothetical protein